MAEITFECPECRQSLAIDAVSAGSQLQCPTCSGPITVPKAINSATTWAKCSLKPIAVAVVITLVALIVIGGRYYYRQSESLACFNSGLVKNSKGDYDGALADFNKSMELNPENAEACKPCIARLSSEPDRLPSGNLPTCKAR